MSPAILESWELKEMGDFHPDLFTSCLSFRASCSFLDFSLIRPIVQSLPVLTSAFLEILHWTCPESYANFMHLAIISLFLSLHLLRQLLKLCLAIVAKIKIKSKLSALECHKVSKFAGFRLHNQHLWHIHVQASVQTLAAKPKIKCCLYSVNVFLQHTCTLPELWLTTKLTV